MMEAVLAQSIVLVALYLIYKVALHRLTFFQLNRAVILFGTGLVLLFPLIGGGVVQKVSMEVFGLAGQLPTINIVNVSTLEETILGRWTLMSVLKVVFWIGVVFNLSKIITSFAMTIKTVRRAKRVEDCGLRFCQSDSTEQAFSFFKWIVVPTGMNESERSLLLLRESIHVQQFHSVDRLICALVSAFMWFNLVVWLLKRVGCNA